MPRHRAEAIRILGRGSALGARHKALGARHKGPLVLGGLLVAALLTAAVMVAVRRDGSVTQRPPKPSVPQPAAGYWRSDLEGVPVGSARADNSIGAALREQWTHYGQSQEREYGYPQIVSVDQEGLPPPAPAGSRVVKLVHEAGDHASQRKLLKMFSARNWPSGNGTFRLSDGTPDDVSARYIVFEYIPSAQLRLQPGGWINLAQLKEGYSASDGTQGNDPSWWLVIYNRDGRPMLDLAHWSEGAINGPLLDMAPYLDGWLKIEMRVYQHDRLEVYLNDQLFDTGRQSQYPVGRMRYEGKPVGDGGAVVRREEGWIFGAGNYSNPSSPGSGSLVYVDLATVLPLP